MKSGVSNPACRRLVFKADLPSIPLIVIPAGNGWRLPIAIGTGYPFLLHFLGQAKKWK